MAICKYTLYKYVKVEGAWRYCKAAYHDNGKIKPDIVFVNVKQALLEKHPEGRYYMSHKGQWIDAGTDALEAQRKRKQRLTLDELNRLSRKGSAQTSVARLDSDKITLAAAAEKYLSNCEARGLDAKTIRKYRAAVDPFVEHCGATYVDECKDNKQVMYTYMRWLRKQPVQVRKSPVTGAETGNPERSLANKVGDVRIFLKEFGVTKLLKKNEEPKYYEKKVVAHPDNELNVLYHAAGTEEIFLLDFFIGSIGRRGRVRLLVGLPSSDQPEFLYQFHNRVYSAVKASQNRLFGALNAHLRNHILRSYQAPGAGATVCFEGAEYKILSAASGVAYKHARHLSRS